MKRKAGAIAGLAGLTWFAGVAGWIAHGAPPDDGPADVAIVLGAAVDGAVPTPVFAARIDHAVRLYREKRAARLLFTGGRSPEDGSSEAQAAAAYAIARGVPARDILCETRSRTTHENVRNAATILRRQGRGRVLIVSDPLHMRRAMAMARGEGIDARASPTPTSRYRTAGTQVPFLMREVFFIHVYWLAGQ